MFYTLDIMEVLRHTMLHIDPSTLSDAQWAEKFLQLAAKVVTQTDRRNQELAPTTIVNTKK